MPDSNNGNGKRSLWSKVPDWMKVVTVIVITAFTAGASFNSWTVREDTASIKASVNKAITLEQAKLLMREIAEQEVGKHENKVSQIIAQRDKSRDELNRLLQSELQEIKNELRDLRTAIATNRSLSRKNP